jgi:benzodiazapine receptor
LIARRGGLEQREQRALMDGSEFTGEIDAARRNKLVLFAFLLATLAVGALSSVFTEPGVSGWYTTIARPSFNPPNWIFAPVWTALYALMAVAAWRVWRVSGLRTTAMALYAIQLALNFVWSFLFFSLHRIDLALGEIVLLLAFILATAIAFFRRDTIAGLMFLPYLAWVGFAAVLTYSIWLLNGGG